jgi:hypothetical protein
MMLLAVVSSSALAEWVEIGHNEDFVGYIDPSTIHRAGNMVKMWCLIDHKIVISKTGKTYISVMAQHEYDCRKDRARMLFSSLHSENMGKGKIVGSNYSPDAWGSVPPLSIVETLWKFACGRR